MKYRVLRQIIMLFKTRVIRRCGNCLALSVLWASVKVYLDLKNTSLVSLFAAIEQQNDFPL